jgi:histone H3/H4
MIVVRTQIKDLLKESGTNVQNISSDFCEKLDAKVRKLVIDACKRAAANNRRTAMARDI